MPLAFGLLILILVRLLIACGKADAEQKHCGSDAEALHLEVLTIASEGSGRNPGRCLRMVGGTGIEPVTPTMST